MSDVIRIEYTPALRDFQRFNWYLLYRRFWWLFLVACLLLLYFAFAPFMPQQDHPSALTAYGRAWGALLYPVMFLIVVPLTAVISTRRRWKNAAEIREPRSYEFSDAGIKVAGPSFQASVSWQNIGRAETTGTLILLFTRQNLAYLIPEGSFQSEKDANEFKALLRQKVNNCRRLRDAAAIAP